MDVDGSVANTDTVRINPVHAGSLEFRQTAIASFRASPRHENCRNIRIRNDEPSRVFVTVRQNGLESLDLLFQRVDFNFLLKDFVFQPFELGRE